MASPIIAEIYPLDLHDLYVVKMKPDRRLRKGNLVSVSVRCSSRVKRNVLLVIDCLQSCELDVRD